jgi:hypothetical protein
MTGCSPSFVRRPGAVKPSLSAWDAGYSVHRAGGDSGNIVDVTVTPHAPSLTFFARLEVEVADPIDLGIVSGAHRRIVPINGGTVHGPSITGTVLPGGADFQVLHEDARQTLEAKYAFVTDDGVRIYVENQGIRTGSAADLALLAQGETVDPARIYFRSYPQFSAPAGPWAWLGSRLFVGTGERHPDRVCLNVFVID